MKLTISKNLVIKNASKSIENYCSGKLTLDNPEYLVAKRLGRYLGNIEKQIKLYVRDGDNLVLPYGCLSDVWKLCKGCEYELKFHDFIGNNMRGNIDLYDYQKNALQSLLKGKNGILEAPCGSGKTNIGLQLIKEVGGRALW